MFINIIKALNGYFDNNNSNDNNNDNDNDNNDDNDNNNEEIIGLPPPLPPTTTIMTILRFLVKTVFSKPKLVWAIWADNKK